MSKLDKLVAQARDHLESGEAIQSALLGTYEAKVMGSEIVRAGILLATDRRVVFYAKKVGGYELESFPYRSISSFEQGKNMMGHHVTFHASGNRVHVKWIPVNGNVAVFTQQVQGAISATQQWAPPPTVAMMNQPPPPPPGYQPRPQFDPPSYQQLPPAPAEAKRQRWPWIVAAVVAVIVIGSVANAQQDTDEAGSSAAAHTTASSTMESSAADTTSEAPTTPRPPAPTTTQAPAPPPEPELSPGQENALRTASDYLDYTAFSRTGLIGQLEFEGYSTADSTWAVDQLGVDWNEQAALSAADYLDYTSFSRQGLVDQLIFEGFSAGEAEYGVAQAYDGG